MTKHDVAPARLVLEEATAVHDQLGHENLGSLSYTHGFLPRQEPLKNLPASHRAWDEIAADIPRLFRTSSVRSVLGQMPLLSASQADLPDQYLLRAASLFGILAHLYWYSEPEPPENGIPQQIQVPWEQISKRLDRPAPHLSFIDLNSHNWHFIDPSLKQPFIVENLKLAIPMIGNEDERRFQTTPIEMLYLFSPLMETILAAQEAVLHHDNEHLKEALTSISDALQYVTYVSLMKVNPNPFSDSYINPVVWGKTAALFASPFQPAASVPGPSGTYIPSFTTLDVFFGRKKYQTTVGHETDRTRQWFPKYWREWLTALEAVSVPDYVMQFGDKTLKGIYDEAREIYAGETGLLSRHRLKAYGFLDLSFKAGRVKTLGGVSGSYSERVWDRMASELDESRLERYGSYPATTYMVPVKRTEPLGKNIHQSMQRIVFDIADTGLRYQAGDRCGILPENSDELVEKTLHVLGATGDEMIQLNAVWRWHVNLRAGYQNATTLPLRILLKFGRIRPVERTVALGLYRITRHERLQKILDAWAEDQWELWDMLAMLAETGYNPKRLLKAVPGDYEHLCRIIPPERWRLYSISSILEEHPHELHLTVGGLEYQTSDTDVSRHDYRRGTSSDFLARLAEGGSATCQYVSLKVIHPPRFSLPHDHNRPVVMFAGGTGIAPMRGLIYDRLQSPESGSNWLFFGTRQRDDFYYQEEFEPLVSEGKLEVRVAFSRDDITAQFDTENAKFRFVPDRRHYLDEEMLKEENARLLWDMIRSEKEGGQGAFLYLCGRTSFATTVMDTIKQIILRFVDSQSETQANQILYRLIGEGRLMLEIFTTYAGMHFDSGTPQFNLSDVVLHNDDAHGYWIVVSGRVYDVTEFNHIHPGGTKIIQSYSGMDATFAYQKVEHHVNSEVDAMLGMYRIGVLRTPDFGQKWGVAISGKGLRFITLRDVYYAWVDVLYMIVEIENAILNDFRIRNEPFTDAETIDHVLLTPSKVQQISLSHERLMTGYLPHVLGEPLETLWALTVGLLGLEHLDIRWMRQQLMAIQMGTQAQAALQYPRTLRNHIMGDEKRLTASNRYFEAQYGELCDFLEREDRHLLQKLKLAIREGVKVFEELGPETVTSSRPVEVLQTLPNILDGFFGVLFTRIRE